MKTEWLRRLNKAFGIGQVVIALIGLLALAVLIYLHVTYTYTLELKTRKDIGAGLSIAAGVCALFGLGRTFVRIELKRRNEQCGSAIVAFLLALVAIGAAYLFFNWSLPSS